MLAFKFPKLHRRRLRSYCSSIAADSESSYLNKHIESFLSNNNGFEESRTTLLSTHAYIITTGHAHNRFLASKLIASYAALNQLDSATRVFDFLAVKDTFLWNSIIKAHFSNGNYAEAVDFFSEMRVFGALPNQFTIPMVVSACAELGSVCIGLQIHCLVSKLNLFHGNSAVGASFVYMYSKCGDVEDACHVFDEMPVRDVVAWTALVIGYVQNGESEQALQCLCKMHHVGGYGERPNSRTLEGGFQACGDLGALVEGRCLHGLALKFGTVSSRIVQSAILSMYSKCGSIEDSRVSFSEVVNKDLLSWTSIIGVYSRLGCIYECFRMFSRMLDNGIYPDGMVISCLISGFANSSKVSAGKEFHGFIVRRKYDLDRLVCNSLLSMYCKFGLDMNCVKMFGEMQHRGFESNSNSTVSAISSCARLREIRCGRSIHCHVVRNLMLQNVSVANSLISMYGKCRSLTVAQRLFYNTKPDIATWNSLISSYNDNGEYLDALNLFDKMISQGVKANTATLLSLLSACTHIASLENGRKIHNYIIEEGIKYEVSVATSLVDMYAKCGQIETAKEIFDSTEEKDVISWNVMISCYGMHGDGKSAIQVFEKMERCNERIFPNELTFLALLSACAHAGLVNEAESLFVRMKEYSLVPSLKHYACMVDLYGKSGGLDKAEALILSMPFVPDGGIWGSLLTACKMHNNAEMGLKIAKRAIEADPENDGYYILMSDFYSSMEMWENVEQVRKMMKDRGVKKTAGWSSV
ncbi:hypothetical protein ABFS82_01G096800 [Erythranthe guttata]|uniref:pentatricopeptide repeat-containing protein At4g39952, mitochondrial n=1 Tax=Erythranthe guttata TaxID=4155 RepID=UPI00064DCDA5|nr:PREDICTED: pentatricopeptide repeat-containing protein At4g39952, mitochondrial [Erythranthe guttata]|eukprot:XP_012827302.1 PREDICTED: pentatricopeptide repeat-containing protein At4g39952, mitochondrial [Erythranthe guttata]